MNQTEDWDHAEPPTLGISWMIDPFINVFCSLVVNVNFPLSQVVTYSNIHINTVSIHVNTLHCQYTLEHLLSSAAMAPQVLIVGAGVTGSMLALLAKDMGLSVRVLEKSRGAGGRMATHTFRRGDRSSPILAHADLGAQYVTTRTSPEHPFLGPLYKRLTDAGVLIPFTGEVAGANPYGTPGPEIRHFAAPQGMRSIAEYFLQSSSVPVDWGVALEDLALETTGIAVTGELPEEAKSPSVVVLTQPVPQILDDVEVFHGFSNSIQYCSFWKSLSSFGVVWKCWTDCWFLMAIWQSFGSHCVWENSLNLLRIQATCGCIIVSNSGACWVGRRCFARPKNWKGAGTR